MAVERKAAVDARSAVAHADPDSVGRQTFVVKNPQYPPRELAVEVMADTEVSVKVDLTQVTRP